MHSHRFAASAARVLFGLVVAGSMATSRAAEPTLPEVLTAAEAAAWLRVDVNTLEAMATAGAVPARRIGGAWRFARDALLAWLAGGPAQPAPGAAMPAALLEATRARGPADGAPAPATVGEAPPRQRSAEAVALRDQSALLPRGRGSFELGWSYSRAEQSLLGLTRTETNTFGASATVRYGLFDDVQLTARLPALWRRTATYTDGSVPGDRVSKNHDGYLGDAGLSALAVVTREGIGRPNTIVSLDAVLPTGPGDRGIGAGIVLTKSFDPAVLFAGLGYLRGFASGRPDARRTLARHNVSATFGTTYALNDAIALNTLVSGTYRTGRETEGLIPTREGYALQLGMTWMLARRLYLEPALALRIGGDRPDMTLSLNLPYTF